MHPCSFAGGGRLTRQFFAGVWVRPVLPVSSVVVVPSFASVVGSPFLSSAFFACGNSGSSASSRGSCHLAGPCGLPSRSVASIRRSVSVGQTRRGNVSTKGCDVVAASIVAPSVAFIQS